jgi:hypothetical protein
LKFENPSEILDHLKTILLLIERQSKDKESYLMLSGYIQKHTEICPESDCPLKTSNHNETNTNSDHETTIRLIRVIERIYVAGTKKFKKSVKLRISYAFFLLERLNLRKKALEELMVADNLNPSFEDQFFIYRYKKIIEDNLGDQSNKEETKGEEVEVDIVGLIAFKTQLTMCTYYVKAAAETQKLYWTELLGDQPMIENLNQIGNQVDFQIRMASENWTKMSKMNRNAPLIIKLYSKFLLNILNDKHASSEQLDYFFQVIKQIQHDLHNDFSDLQKINTNSAVMIVRYNPKTPGLIENANNEFCTMFGYNKDFLISKSFDIIFPNLYLNYRENFLNCILESRLNRIQITELFWRG